MKLFKQQKSVNESGLRLPRKYWKACLPLLFLALSWSPIPLPLPVPATQPLFSAVPVKFNYQGNLRQNGFLVNGSRNVIFSLYDSSTAPAALWTSASMSVQFSTGVFRVALEPTTLTDWESGSLWLELEINGTKLSPREEITSSPYAVNSLLISGKRYNSAPAEPALPHAKGDLWMDTAGNTLKYWNGGGWTDTSGGIVAGSGDNLGNHVATMTLNMGTFGITNAGALSAVSANLSGGVTALSMAATTAAGVSAPRVLFAGNVAVSSETSGALGGGLRVSSNVYIVGFASATKFFGDGSGLTGLTAIGDGLGTHLATQVLDLNNWDMIRVSSINFKPNVYVSSAPAAQLGGVYVSSNIYIVGVASATKYYGDGSGLTGLTAIGDGLGTHLATQVLDLNSWAMIRVSSINFNPNVYVSSAPAAQFGGVYVSSNIYIVGIASATKYYGDGSALTGISGGGGGSDNLGSHVATATLNMNSWDMINVSSISFKSNVYVSSAGPALLGGLYVSSNVYIVGTASATRFFGDGSGLTGLTGVTAVGDGLGSHVATTTLNMAGNLITGVPMMRLNASAEISSASAANYGGIYTSSNVFVNGNVYATKLYGDGSGLTGVGGGTTRQSVTRALPTTVNGYVAIGKMTMAAGGTHNLLITVTVSDSGFSVAKQYLMPLYFDMASAVRRDAIPIANSGAFGGNDFALEVRSVDADVSFRLRRTAGTSAATALVTIDQLGYSTDVFTPDTNTGTSIGLPYPFMETTGITQTGGNVGVGTTDPASKLEVAGNVNLSGALRSLTLGGGQGIKDTGTPDLAVFTSASSPAPLLFRPADTELARMTTDLKFGVGTNAPSYRLHVSSGAGAAGTVMAVSTGATNLFWVAGDGAHAVKFFGDGSGLTGISGGGGGSDNLGSHVATMTLNMNSWDMTNVPAISFRPNVSVSSAPAAQLGGLYVSTNVYIAGVASATKFYGDGSGLTGISGSDNLGNHTATITLDMANNQIQKVSSLTITGPLGIGTPKMTLGPNVEISSTVILGPVGISVNSYIYTAGMLIGSAGELQSVGLGLGSAVGAARGTGAVDLQVSRSLASQAATGIYSLVGGGQQNTAGGQYAVASGGFQNTAGNNYATIGGGTNNNASAVSATVGGGQQNTATGQYSVVSGGTVNVANNTNSAVGGGTGNNASGISSAVGGGQQNVASNNYSVVGGGVNNNASGDTSMIPGGRQNNATSAYTFAAGNTANSGAPGAFTWADSEGVTVNNNTADLVRFKARGGFLVSGSTNAVMGGTVDRGFMVTGSGRVGIARSSPAAALDVAADGSSASDMAAIWRNSAGTAVSSVSATGVVSALSVAAPRTVFNTGAELSSAAAANYGGVYSSSHVFVNGNVYATRLYGDGSTLDGVSARAYVTRTLPVLLNEYVEIGNLDMGTGNTHNLYVSVTVADTGFSVAKQYLLPLYKNMTASNVRDAMPISNTGASGGNDFALEVKVTATKAFLYLRRTAGSTAGTALVVIQQVGYSTDVFTPTSDVGGPLGGLPYPTLATTGISQTGGNVGIGTENPGAKLEVAGQIKVTGGGTPTAGKVLTSSDGTGLAAWQDIPSSADNLGNHTATITLQMAGFGIVNVSSIAANGYITASSMTVRGDAFSVGGSTLVVKQGNIGIGAPDPEGRFTIGVSSGIGINTNSMAGYSLGIHHGAARISNPETGAVNPTYSLLDLLVSRENVVAGGQAAVDFSYRIRQTNLGPYVVARINGGMPDGASPYDPDGVKGSLAFMTMAPSGLAGVPGVLTTRMVVTKDGNVGVGTTTPGDRLEVNGGSIKVSALAGTGNRCVTATSAGILSVSATDCATGGSGADNLGNHIATQNVQLRNFWVSSDGDNEGIRVDNGGNVGIGTPAPGEKLEVNGGSIKVSALGGIGNRCVKATSAGILAVSDTDCATGGSGADDLGSHIATQNVQLRNYWLSRDGDNEGISVDSSGSIGVGTTDNISYNGTASTKTVVLSGAGTSTVVADNDVGLVIRNSDTTADNTSGLHFAAANGAGAGNMNPIDASIVAIHGARTPSQYQTGQLAFLTSTIANQAPSEKVRVDNAGNVGIGTPAPAAKLDINTAGGSRLQIDTSNPAYVSLKINGVEFARILP